MTENCDPLALSDDDSLPVEVVQIRLDPGTLQKSMFDFPGQIVPVIGTHTKQGSTAVQSLNNNEKHSHLAIRCRITLRTHVSMWLQLPVLFDAITQLHLMDKWTGFGLLGLS